MSILVLSLPLLPSIKMHVTQTYICQGEDGVKG